MKVLFAVSNSENNDDDDIVDVILNEYQRAYKKIITYKRAFYYDAILNEIRETRDNNRYDLIVISEDLEKNLKDTYDSQDEILYKRMDELTDEAYKEDGTIIPIILICNERRTERDPIIQKLFVLGIYNVLVGREKTIQNVCSLIEKPRNKKQAKLIYGIIPSNLSYNSKVNADTISQRELVSIIKFFNVNQNNTEKCVKGFAKIAKEYSEEQLKLVIKNLPVAVRLKLQDNSSEYTQIVKERISEKSENNTKSTLQSKDLAKKSTGVSSSIIIPGQDRKKGIFRKLNGKN